MKLTTRCKGGSTYALAYVDGGIDTARICSDDKEIELSKLSYNSDAKFFKYDGEILDRPTSTTMTFIKLDKYSENLYTSEEHGITLTVRTMPDDNRITSMVLEEGNVTVKIVEDIKSEVLADDDVYAWNSGVYVVAPYPLDDYYADM